MLYSVDLHGRMFGQAKEISVSVVGDLAPATAAASVCSCPVIGLHVVQHKQAGFHGSHHHHHHAAAETPRLFDPVSGLSEQSLCLSNSPREPSK